MSTEMSVTADTADAALGPVQPGDSCAARAACRSCEATIWVSGRDPASVLEALADLLAWEGWSVAPGGLRLCRACAAKEAAA